MVILSYIEILPRPPANCNPLPAVFSTAVVLGTENGGSPRRLGPVAMK